MRTKNSTSPLALWHSEIVHTGVDDFDVGEVSLFGIDPDAPVGELETDSNVVVPESTIQLTEYQLNEIRNLSQILLLMMVITKYGITLPYAII